MLESALTSSQKKPAKSAVDNAVDKGDKPVVMSVENISKTFLMPHQKVHTLKETILHPFRKYSVDRVPVLKEIDFKVKQGEFFGIIGRNGSGKSTLLKCLAGIYRTEEGDITIRGKLSPFIELGVGFNPDLNARDNVYVNAALLGIPQREVRKRFDEIIAFAELEDFVDLKFKNYSSGMQVRLGFSSAIQVDADILLIDEVLAVGDASFQQKCFDTFRRLKREGTTIIFVSHDLHSIQSFCDRVLYLESGRIVEVDEPSNVVRKYLDDTAERQRQRDQIERDSESKPASTGKRWGTGEAEILEVWVSDKEGERTTVLKQEEPATIQAVVKFHEPLEDPTVVIAVHCDDDNRTLIFGASNQTADKKLPPVSQGSTLEVALEFPVWLANGRYFVSAWVANKEGSQMVDQRSFIDNFLVQGYRGAIGTTIWPHEFNFNVR